MGLGTGEATRPERKRSLIIIGDILIYMSYYIMYYISGRCSNRREIRFNARRRVYTLIFVLYEIYLYNIT